MKSETGFIHAINPKSKHAAYACLNLVNGRTLWSSDYLANLDTALAAAHVPLKTLPLEVIAHAPFPPGALTPASSYLLLAALAATNDALRYGDGKELAPALIQYSKKRAEKELRFEAQRRLVAPAAPSRLSCLWLAEDTEAGRVMLKDNLFGARPSLSHSHDLGCCRDSSRRLEILGFILEEFESEIFSSLLAGRSI
jgi:hypothetical protein